MRKGTLVAVSVCLAVLTACPTSHPRASPSLSSSSSTSIASQCSGTKTPSPVAVGIASRGEPSTLLAGINTMGSAGHSSLVLLTRSSGAPTKTLLSCKDAVSIGAVRTRDGTIVVVIGKGCATAIQSIDPHTGRVREIRQINNEVTSPALSPDGRRLAYITRPRCLVQGNGSGPIQFNPNVAAITDLSTGHTMLAPTPNPGNPVGNLRWSPDGKHLIAQWFGPNNFPIIVFDVAHFSFARGHIINPPKFCTYQVPAWTTNGIIASKGCTRDTAAGAGLLSPFGLVRLNLAGKVLQEWPLPKCIDGIRSYPDAIYRDVLVTADVGYQGCPPGPGGASRQSVLELTGGKLSTLFQLHPESSGGDETVVGW